MDRLKFKEKMEDTYSYDYLDDATINSALEIIVENTEPLSSTATNGNDRVLLIAMEELAELSQEISKFLRGKGNPIGILEELADVSIVIRQIKSILHINNTDLNKAICIKIDEGLDKMELGKDKTLIK